MLNARQINLGHLDFLTHSPDSTPEEGHEMCSTWGRAGSLDECICALRINAFFMTRLNLDVTGIARITAEWRQRRQTSVSRMNPRHGAGIYLKIPELFVR